MTSHGKVNMENRRYDYSPVNSRTKLAWPHGARLAFWIGLNVEYFHFDKPTLSAASPRLPDVQSYSLRDYGLRVGIFRIMKVLDKFSLRASVLLNSDVCARCPNIIAEGKKRNWEWLGHGMTNNRRISDYSSEEERSVIKEVRETITAAAGVSPKGWLGPVGAESFDTPDHLAAEGFEYVCDWASDDEPIPMRVREGRMIALPYQQGVNDLGLLFQSHYSPEQYYRQVCDQFDTLYEEGGESGKVMALPLHTFVIGLAYRIQYLERALAYICSHTDLWLTTGGEIADWYYKTNYEKPSGSL
jgi:peptidoglycan/xylan/chitin deacetylase (PgdA/CDA1 family)